MKLYIYLFSQHTTNGFIMSPHVWCRHPFFAHRPFRGILSQALFPIYSHIQASWDQGLCHSCISSFVHLTNTKCLHVPSTLSSTEDTVVTQIECVSYPHLQYSLLGKTDIYQMITWINLTIELWTYSAMSIYFDVLGEV